MKAKCIHILAQCSENEAKTSEMHHVLIMKTAVCRQKEETWNNVKCL